MKTCFALLFCIGLTAAVSSAAVADDMTVPVIGTFQVGANGRNWEATPVNWSDGRVSIIVVPETPDPALQSTDAAVAVQRYITQSGRDCTFDGVLHAVGPEVTGSSAGWAGSLSCKP